MTSLGYFVSTCIFIGCSLGGSFGSSFGSVFRKSEDILQKQTIRCNQYCPYGFETDIEGFYTCKCYKPCANLLCFSGYKCVVDMPANCDWEPCKPVASCQEDTIVTSHQKTKPGAGSEFDGPKYPIQQDGPWWAVGNSDDVCSQPLTEAATSCKRKRRRWFYNSLTGKCERFMGCDIPGNSFPRKRYCKTKCRNKRRAFRRAQRKNMRKHSPR